MEKSDAVGEEVESKENEDIPEMGGSFIFSEISDEDALVSS